MSNSSYSSEIKEITPPFAGITGIIILAWIVFGIFDSLDENRYYFALAMFAAGLLSAYQLRYSRRTRNPIQGSTVAFFVIIWLAVFSFTSEDSALTYQQFTFTLHQLELVSLLPLVLIWLPPHNEEKFFGLRELEYNDKLHAIWRFSVLFMVLVKIFQFGDEWYWISLEFIILIPMIIETTQLHTKKKDDIPILTLFIQTELGDKFSVPISMFKSVFLIIIGFIFGIIVSRLWLLVILIYFAVVLVWGFTALLPEDVKSSGQEDDLEAKIENKIKEFFGEKPKEDEMEMSDEYLDEDGAIQEIGVITNEVEKPSEPTDLVKIDGSIDIVHAQNAEVPAGSIQEKAHAMGKRVRSGIEKPYYTLNHILSTLKEEDFSKAWRVEENGLIFPSKRGEWSPNAGLVLFPIELEYYDYRRADEILLLGFSKPLLTKEMREKRKNQKPGKNNEMNFEISNNLIKFGDVEFNTRSLIVTRNQWSEIQNQLDEVTQDDDISYTGFKTLKQMQQVLASLSDKWLEVRLTAQEVAVNFLAGLLGSSKPVFIPREGLDAPKSPQLENDSEYKLLE
ncbi:MAG: hypothetical protein INQ03_03625 [Candidatus Heimdallarchaeota archaeon]|nr:hypothetical protein [Candidatus Heimdallarchaeota archaeon]